MSDSSALEPRGSLNKSVIRDFIEFGCERQLFWHMGDGDPRWMAPARRPSRSPTPVREPELLLEMGRRYEQDVYARMLVSHLDVRARRGAHERVVSTALTADLLRVYARECVERRLGSILMLEHEWRTPPELLRWIIGLGEGEVVPIAKPSMYCRPDIMAVVDRRGHADRSLGPRGRVDAVAPEDPRLALRVMDVKHTNSEDVGKKQFTELLFYAHSLAMFLRDHGLDDLLYVSTDGCGILPVVNLNRARVDTLEQLGESVVEMVWDNHAHLFSLALRAVRTLWEDAPLPVEDIELVIQPACARCRYVHDCKRTLGWSEGSSGLGSVDVRLLPGTSSSTAEQLRNHLIETVTQLEARVDDLPVPASTPSPLFAERELLKLKARALVAGHRVLPNEEEGDRRHMSVALPPYADVVLSFNAEADPTHDCVFAFGVHADIRSSERSPLGSWHDAWWSAWDRALSSNRRRSYFDAATLLDVVINPELHAYFLAQDPTLGSDALERRYLTRLNLFADILWGLRERGELELIAPADATSRWRVRYGYAFISQGYRPEHELRLAHEMVRQFQGVLALSSIYEELVAVVEPSTYDPGSFYTIAPTSAVFFWSRDQLEHAQELMERHLTELMTDPDICVDFHQLLQLLNPSESGIEREYLHKKVYDLRVFAETCVGLPQIINYTWHEVAAQELSYAPKFSSTFWAPNFNYMDFLTWHEYLSALDPSQAAPLRDEASRKAKVIGQLARLFQSAGRGRDVLTPQSRPIPTHAISWRSGLIKPEYNFLARSWALYSKLTASVQAQDALHARLSYPDYSIGKLAAARVSGLTGRLDEDGVPRFVFRLEGVSSNMKLSEGSYVLLVPEHNRDAKLTSRSKENVIIDTMVWNAASTCYDVTARGRYKDHPFLDETVLSALGWYLYPTSSDTWSTKLFEGKRDTLFKRHDIGSSWLGTRAAYLLDLLPADAWVPTRPEGYAFSLPELYAYAPRLLPSAPEPTSTPGGLSTPCAPRPDASQRVAIEMALSHTVCCIQGPPGTGKSQTIAALIDEFLERRRGRRARVLVASFSYVPLQVVAEKICAQVREDGSPTLAAAAQKVFLRSQGRAPFDLPGVLDLYRRGDSLYLDEVAVTRKRDKTVAEGYRRLEDSLEDSFVMFGPAQQLFYLAKPSSSKSMALHFLHSDFAFDMIIIDEASQMPVDQSLTSLCLTRRGEATLALPEEYADRDRVEVREHLEEMPVRALTDHEGGALAPEALTRVVIVGDHNQLPPVQPVEVPTKLRPILGSLFEYYVRHQGVPSHQLTNNYRSHPDIVGYTRYLGLYQDEIVAVHQGEAAYPPLPDPPAGLEPWLDALLSDARVVSALIHDEAFETAISPLEAGLVARIVDAFHAQMSPGTPEEERFFWREHVGIVAPHNAQGRLITRLIAARMASRSLLDPAELESLLRQTIYTVEKFQGSARTLIIASVGISARTQLAAEEAFIYDINRLNVLTSRARQKMIMICSSSFLDYVPRRREVVASAARSRDYALVYCNAEEHVATMDGSGEPMYLRMRWHDPTARLARVPRPAPSARVETTRAPPAGAVYTPRDEVRLRAALAALGLDFDTLPAHQLALFACSVLQKD